MTDINKQFDVFVIGSGSAGQAIAFECAKEKLKVGIADNRPFGGTCELRGCDPKKVLVGIAESFDQANRFKGKGLSSDGLSIDWPDLISFKQTFVKDVPAKVEKNLRDCGIETFSHTVSFMGEHSLSVGDYKITAKKIVIATGAKPISLNINGEENVLTSDDFLDLQNLPKRIIFIGGGYISFEFAHIARRAGAEVTILHRGSQVLNVFDKDLVEKLVKATSDLGIKIITNCPVDEVEKNESGGYIVRISSNNISEQYEADAVFHGAGRFPNIEDLQLEKGGIEFDIKKGISVNEFLQSISNDSVYSAGDACSIGLPLTPIAGKEGIIAAQNIIHGNISKAGFNYAPSTVFTIPQLAMIGLTQEQVEEKGIDCVIKYDDMSPWYSSKRINETISGFKTIVDKNTGMILGAHYLGHNAEEIINLFAISMIQDIPAEKLKQMLYSYPSRASDIAYML